MGKCSVPNWSQALIAQAVGLDLDNVAVEHEDDRTISFLQFQPRKSIAVGKIDGTWVVSCQTGTGKGYGQYGH